ncbi:MAG: hypothetical protein GC161_13935 [Planctomycetaceae bacterium]|nr:hypothetical protein [Planctomycetaceae bacterium]
MPMLAVAACLLALPSAHAGVDAEAARAALEARCAECHRPDGADAKARRSFDFALDLERVALELVVPGEPDLSELWLEIDNGSMPPDDSPTGPLSDAEREAIRAWIAAGAPLVAEEAAVPAQESEQPTGAEDDVPSGAAEPALPSTRSSRGPEGFAAIGRLHPAAVHFPIAFLLGAALLEGLWALRGGVGALLGPAVLVLARLAALCAPPVALLGWWNALDTSASDTLELHRWLGVAAAALALLVWGLAERAGAGRRGPLRIALVLAALTTAAAGHFGGILVFGDGYLPF